MLSGVGSIYGQTTQGRDFWVGFLHNGNCDYDQADGKTLAQAVAANQWTLVASSEKAGTVTVTCAGWSTTANLMPGGSVTINVPYETATTTLARWTRPCYSRQIRPAGIHVTATTDIALYAYNYNTASFDATTVLPTQTLGKHYILNDFNYYIQAGIAMLPDYYDGGEMCIVATENNTTVDIIFHSTVQIDTFAFSTPAWQPLSHSTHYSGNHFRTLTLQQGQYIQLLTPGQYSFAGTEISSSKPVAVFMGRKRTTIPYARNSSGQISTSWCCADHIYEQAIPTNQWGTEFVIVPDHRTTNAERSYFDIVSLENDCSVTCSTATGTTFSIPTLASGENYLRTMSSDNTPVYISASKPVSVCLYLGSNKFCGNEGDPSSIVIPPIDNGTNRAVFFAFDNLGNFSHRTNIVIPTAAVGGMRLDGTDISSQFTPIGTTDLSYARVSITSGIHTLLNRQGRFSAWFYGMAGAGSYAYTAAMRLRNLLYELYVDGDNTHTWGDTVSLCGLAHHFKIETDGDIDTRWFVDGVLQSSTDTAVDVTFTATGLHDILALQRGDCTAPNFCDTLRLVVNVNPVYSSTVYDTVDDIDLPRVYNGDNHYLPVTDPVYHFTAVNGCDSTVHYNLHIHRTNCPATSTVGRDFWVAFLWNFDGSYTTNGVSPQEMKLIAAGAEDADITVTIGPPALPIWTQSTHLTGGNYVEITLPDWATADPDTYIGVIENHGIHVTSTADISLYASNRKVKAADITTVLPTSALRTHYITQDYPGSDIITPHISFSGSEIAIVATGDGTELEVTLAASDRIHPAGTSFPLTINAGYSYKILSPHGQTLSGTEIKVTNGKPIAVFQGTRLAYVPTNIYNGEHLYDQSTPVDYWGKDFVLVSDTRNYDNRVRITAAENGTVLSIDGSQITTLAARQTYEYVLPQHTAHRLTSTKPVMACLYLPGAGTAYWIADGYGDPSQVTVPPVEQGVCSVVFAAINNSIISDHYANIVTPTVHVNGMTLDGQSIASQFSNLDGEYSYARISVAAGTHTLGNSMGIFSAIFYGLGIMESYAYTTGMAMTQLRNEWTVNCTPHNHTGDTITACYQDTVEFAVIPATEDHAIRWYVDDILQSESSLTLSYRFPAVVDTHTVMAVMHGDCAPDWCDTLSIAVITRVPQSDTFAVVPDTLLWYGNVYDESGVYSRNVLPTPPDGCDSIVTLHLTVTGYPDNVDSVDCTVDINQNPWDAQLTESIFGVSTYFPPTVGDIDGDDTIEIVAALYTTNDRYTNQIGIFRGTNLHDIDTIVLPTGIKVYSGMDGPIALVRYPDGPGVWQGAIVIHCFDNKLRSYDIHGNLLAVSDINTPCWGAASIADFNHDGWPEVYVGNAIYDAATLQRLCAGPADANMGKSYRAAVEVALPFAADVLGDNTLELICGNSIYSVNIVSRTNPLLNSVSLLKTILPPTLTPPVSSDGHVAVADFDKDGQLDVLVIRQGSNYQTYDRTVFYAYNPVNENIIFAHGHGCYTVGFPLVGDIDGDGDLEFVYVDKQNPVTDARIVALKYNTNSNQLEYKWQVPHTDQSGQTSMTLFDFNQDGIMEIVYRDEENLRIINGSGESHLTGNDTIPYNLFNYPMIAPTGTEYPIIADINNDGAAEIIVTGRLTAGNNVQGHLCTFAGIHPWAPARKVWNQYLYNVTNINEDLSVPQYHFNNATKISDLNGVERQPFNNFLQQATTIDRYGRPFTAVPEAVAVSASTAISGNDFNITLEVSNNGDNALNAPYGITLYKDTYRGEVLHTETITNTLPQSSTQTINITLPRSTVCALTTVDSLVIAINDTNTGIAQHGGQQPECDTTNNTIKIAVPHNTISDTTATACDSFTWYDNTYTTSTTSPTHVYTNAYGCDSTITLNLTVNHSNTGTDVQTTCDSYTWIDGNTYTSTNSTATYTLTNTAGCDSVVTLNLTINSSVTSNNEAVVHDTITALDLPYTYHGIVFDTPVEDVIAHAVNVAGCDSLIHYYLHVRNAVCIDTTVAYGYEDCIHAPLYGMHGDYQQRVQSLYQPYLLTHLVGRTIDSLHYDLAYSATSAWCNQTWVVSVGTSTRNNLYSSFDNDAVLTEVYRGPLTANASQGMGIKLDTTFTYTGGKLLIQFTNTSTVGGYASTLFNGVTPDYVGATRWATTYNGGDITTLSGTREDQLPMVTFHYCRIDTTFLSPPISRFGDTTIVACDSLPWNNKILTSSGTYLDTVRTADNHDSLVTLHLTINHSSTFSTEGAINSYFSVDSTHVVEFSKGNLQYQASTNTWRFAEHQYDIIGNNNRYISSTYSGWIDLFGWGCSGWNSGANAYQPYSTSTTASDYYPDGVNINSLTGENAEADWAWHNAISNGGNQPHLWRTPTHSEWQYVFNERTTVTNLPTPNARFAKAKVNNIYGVILFPDKYTHPTEVATPVGINATDNTGMYGNIYNVTAWNKMEQAGAVFLPVPGYRSGTSISLLNQRASYYASSIGFFSNYADGIAFYFPGTIDLNVGLSPYSGNPVRPIKYLTKVKDTIITACNDYIWHGTDYHTTGEYFDTLTNVQGCDSIFSLNLTLYHSYSEDSTLTVCDQVTWYGNMITQSGDFPHTIYSSPLYDCDSIITLHLTVNHSSGTLAEGASPAPFSVSEDVEVYFSPGNLQYRASTGQWRFAEHQYDYIGGGNLQASSSYDGWIDLFGWGCSGWSDGSTTYYPYNTSTTYSTYYQGDSLRGPGSEADWAWHNAIQGGGDKNHTWRALSHAEWLYLINNRTTTTNLPTPNARYAKAMVNGTYGVIVFPDTYTHPYGIPSPMGINQTGDSGWNGNNYTTSQWDEMESAGAIFLPAAGRRNGSSLTNVNEQGRYWTTDRNSNTGKFIYFTNTSFRLNDGISVFNGQSVRPVTTRIKYIDTTIDACNSYQFGTNIYTSSGVYTDSLQNAVGCDSIIKLNLIVNNPTHTSETLTTCDSLIWNNTKYTTSGNYTYAHTDVNGCTQVDTLHLTINHSNMGDTTVTACDNFLWYGNTYTSSTSPTHIYTNAAGCDSTVTLILTINHSNTGTEVVTTCDSYTWHGNTYTSSNNTDTFTETNASGCDSTVTLNLTVNYSNTGVENTTACDIYTWHGTAYTTSNSTATFTETNAANCDSIVTLHLTVNHSSTGIDVQTACDSYTWIDGNTYTTSNNTTLYTLTNTEGCDSTVTLNLTISQSNTGDTSAISCDHFTWWNTDYTNSTDTVTHIYTNTAGCDSVVTLHLTVNYSSPHLDEGTLQATFSVGEGKLVYFSHGNLQYQASTGTWRFAENQYDCILGGNSNISSSYDGWIDLFGWGTSGWNSGAAAYQPYSTSQINSQYYPGGNYTNDLTGDYAEADWAWHNPLSNGGNQTHLWRTLTAAEWQYLLEYREDALLKRGAAKVGVANGIVILPDNWTLPDGLSFNPSFDGWYTNFYNLSQWQQMESAGALFLPAAGYRNGTDVNTSRVAGYYWTTTHLNANQARLESVAFAGTSSPAEVVGNRYMGAAVRPVRDVPASSVNACDSFLWHNHTYTSSGTYIDTLTTIHGCDSVVTLNLAVNYSNAGTDIQTACDSYTWIDGNTYTESNTTATQTLTNVAGCDSTITLNLTINHNNTGTETVTACDNYTWHGTEYTTSNSTATFTETNAADCDSVVTLNLTINYSNTGTDAQSACDSYAWHGTTYTTSNNTATFTETNASGCDSVVTLNLTINYSNTGKDVQTACDSYTWHGTTYTASNNTDTFTETNLNSCDSTVTLNLTINYSNTGIETVTACNSYVWHGTEYTESTSTPTFTSTNVAGCDSITTLNLTINHCSTTTLTTCDSYVWNGTTYTESGTYTAENDTLILTVNHSNTGVENTTACDSYTWHGTTYTTSSNTDTFTETNADDCDSVVTLNLTVNYSNTGAENITACNIYTWHGTAYTTSNNTDTYTETNASGCDSVVTLNLTINYSNTGTDAQTACDSYTWHGTTYSSSNNTATFTETNTAGCDSVITLNLTVNYSNTGTETVTACDSYAWHGTSYNASNNTDTFTETNTSGCDSVVTLNLTVNYSNAGTDEQTACDSYTWHGTSYIASNNTDTFTETNAYGCDSVVTLNLTINYSNTGTDIQTACDSYTWHGTTYTASNNTATFTETNADNCDSTVTLNLTINYSNTGIDTITSCNSYIWHGTEYTESTTTPTFTSTNVAGCDSITTLNLTINHCSTTTLTTCDSYVWNGTTYTESGTYTAENDTLILTVNHSNTGVENITACDTYTWHGTTYTSSNNTDTFTETNVANCDSVVTLNLTVNYSNTGTDVQTACDTYTWIDGNNYTSSNNTATFTMINTAGCDSVVALNLTVNYSNTGVETITACDSYVWKGGIYTTSNDSDTFTETNANNCDSVVTLHLTINYSNTSTDTQTACDSFSWIDGNTYTASNNTAQYTLTNAANCDSLITLNLTINYSNTGTETITACNSYIWHGTEYSESTSTPTFTTINDAGCDSVTTLNLTINHCSTTTITACDSYEWNGSTYTEGGTYTTDNDTLILTINYSNTGTEVVEACDSYIWHGTTYTTSNSTATFTETNTANCDSIVTLNLTVNYSNTGIENVIACDNYTWHETTYTTSNSTATFIETNTADCDSVVTLNLTVNYSNTGIENVTACDNYTWHEITYTASNNTATFTETNIAGCDSVINLDLTINYSNTGTENITACNSYIWHGTEYTESTTTPTFTSTNMAGCDSVTTLNLTINQCSYTILTSCDSYLWNGTTYTESGTYAVGNDTLILTINYSNTGSEIVTACDTYTWHGTTYTASNNTDTFTETNVANCDSVVTLNLTVNHSNTGIENITACDTYTWHETTYTTSNNTDTFTETNAGGCDSVVTLNLTINYSNSSLDIQTACDTYTWMNNQTYTASNNTAQYTLTNTENCDSVITLNLTVNYSNTYTENATACDSYTWHGTTYTSSNNTDTFTEVNAAGCDSVINLNLTINYSNTGTEDITACNSYIWHGTEYTESTTTPTFTGTNVAGCDSVTTLNLTINNCSSTPVTTCDSYLWNGTTYTESGIYTVGNDTLILTVNYSNTGVENITACDIYTWHGTTYTTSNNTDTFTETNVTNCDSVVTLNLVINYSNTGTDVQTACDTYTWIDGQTYSSDNNTAQYTLINAANCDSLVTLNLTVNYSNTGTDVQTACDTYTWHGTTYITSNNTATFTETNTAGCDSIITLNLTINYSSTETDIQTACDAYTWIDGNTYTSNNNTATVTETNAYGCDSVVTLNLTIGYSTTGEDSARGCNSYTWNDSTYTISGDYIQTLTSALPGHCDSTVTLHLTILEQIFVESIDTFCYSSQYHWRGQTIGDNNYLEEHHFTLTDTLISAQSCDTILTLQLVQLKRPELNITDSVDCNLRQHVLTMHTDVPYHWWSTSDGSPIQPSPEALRIIATPSHPTIYYATVDYSESRTCPFTSEIALQPLNPSSTPQIKTIPERLTSDNLHFQAIDISHSHLVHQWYIDGQLQNETSSTLKGEATEGEDSVVVTLEILSGECSDVAVAVIPILQIAIFAPNVFTPQEAENNRFVIYTKGVIDGELTIYNREGLRVYHTTDLQQGWNGNSTSGSLCPQGAYVWHLRYRAVDYPETYRTEVGTITLLK